MCPHFQSFPARSFQSGYVRHGIWSMVAHRWMERIIWLDEFLFLLQHAVEWTFLHYLSYETFTFRYDMERNQNKSRQFDNLGNILSPLRPIPPAKQIRGLVLTRISDRVADKYYTLIIITARGGGLQWDNILYHTVKNFQEWFKTHDG